MSTLMVVLPIVVLGGPPSGALDPAVEAPLLAAECQALTTVDFAEIQDAPTRVIRASLVEAIGELPAYCQVQGLVMPNVGFELQLPTSNWNGKMFEAGCGGFCGAVPIAACHDPLRRGYACIATDMGNRGGVINAQVFYNDLQAQIDFGFRGAHVTALAGKAITEYFYSRAPSQAYFMGCSSGGQQALSEAQRFPWDFDGIVVGAPSPTFSGPMMYYEWAGRHLVGTVTPANLELLHETAVDRCDLDDGLKDHLIGDPRDCDFDPAELLCPAEGQAGCLTGEQVDAVKKVYAGPMTSDGVSIYTGGPMFGSELNWYGGTATFAGMALTAAYGNDDGSAAAAWPSEYFRYVGFMPAQGPDGEYPGFDYDRDYKRLGVSEALFGNANNPDLRKFEAAGGKMIMYNGWADQSDIPSDAIDYYETAEKVMGGRTATQDFFRLFMVPGMNHCWGGEGAFAIDYLSYLEAWVERGEAPDVVIGSHLTGDRGPAYRFPLDPARVDFTRPVYPYPLQARYDGSGDPNEAGSFVPVDPEGGGGREQP